MNEPDDLSDDAFEHKSEDAFEREMATALRPVAPPVGFTERVLARACSPSVTMAGMPEQVRSVARRRLWFALAACLLFAALGFGLEQRHAQRLRRQEARARFEMSMAITRETLAEVGARTREQMSAAGIQLER